MNADELEDLFEDCPTLFHMAEGGSWPAIKARGLLSTTALLDMYGVSGDARSAVEQERRANAVTLERQGLPLAVVRDQLPMDDVGLRRALPKNMQPSDWYRLLNSRVFFWLTKERLMRLLGAAAYRNTTHDVLEVDSRSLVSNYRDDIWLSPINSGCTKPFPHPRDEATFSRIPDYPYDRWRKKRKRGERVVELCVDVAVPDIARFVTRVTRMKGHEISEILFKA